MGHCLTLVYGLWLLYRKILSFAAISLYKGKLQEKRVGQKLMVRDFLLVANAALVCCKSYAKITSCSLYVTITSKCYLFIGILTY